MIKSTGKQICCAEQTSAPQVTRVAGKAALAAGFQEGDKIVRRLICVFVMFSSLRSDSRTSRKIHRRLRDRWRLPCSMGGRDHYRRLSQTLRTASTLDIFRL